MQVIYKPKRNKDTSVISGQQEAYALLVPDTPRDKYFFFMVIHGVGEWSNGTIDNLINLVEGFDNNNDGIREGRFITDDIKKAVDTIGMIVAVVTYEKDTSFEPSRINYVYDQVKANYSIYERMMLSGFSLGGGAVYKYITSSLANALRVAYALPIAGTRNLVDKTIPGKAGTVVHGFSNIIDPRVASSNTTSQIASINESNPAVKALYTLWDRNDHSGDKDVWSITPPKAPGGQGFTDAAENIFQVFTDIVLSGKPRQMKSGTVINPIPIENETTPPTSALQPVLEHKIIGNTVYLDGSKSTGMKSAKLSAVEVPIGVNIWNTSIEGGGSASGKITLPTPGKYKFRLTIYPEASYKGTPAEKDIDIEIGGAAQPEPFKATHTMITEDGIKKQIRLEEL